MTGSLEVGGAIDTSGKKIAFSGGCAGVEVGDEAAALDGSLVFGFWNELGSIPGKSITTGASIATPGKYLDCYKYGELGIGTCYYNYSDGSGTQKSG